METEKVTREQLAAIEIGDNAAFELPNYAAVESARNTAYQYSKVLGCRFKCTTGKGNPNQLIITRYAIDEA